MYADSIRSIEAKVEQNASSGIDYSKIGTTYVTTQKRHISKTFLLNDASDADARVVFNTGMSNVDVYIDNVSLKYVE